MYRISIIQLAFCVEFALVLHVKAFTYMLARHVHVPARGAESVVVLFTTTTGKGDSGDGC